MWVNFNFSMRTQLLNKYDLAKTPLKVETALLFLRSLPPWKTASSLGKALFVPRAGVSWSPTQVQELSVLIPASTAARDGDVRTTERATLGKNPSPHGGPGTLM